MKTVIHLLVWLCIGIITVQAQNSPITTTPIIIQSDAVTIESAKVDGELSGKQLHVLTKVYHACCDGQLCATTGKHTGQLLHGPTTEFDTNTGEPMAKGQYNLGLKDGSWEYWQAGQLIRTEEWDQGYESGTWILYDEQGQLVCIRQYKKGFLNGPATSYLNGEPYWQCAYRKGLLTSEYLVGEPAKTEIPGLPHEL